MNPTGKVATIDKLGRVKIPKILRKQFELHENIDYVEFDMRDDTVFITKIAIKNDDLPHRGGIDGLGRVVIPVEMRRKMNLDTDSVVDFFADENSICIRKYKPLCVFCSERPGSMSFKGKKICEGCKSILLEKINKGE